MSDNPNGKPASTPSQARRQARVARAERRFMQASGASVRAEHRAREWAREEADSASAPNQRKAAEAEALAWHLKAVPLQQQYFLEKEAAEGADLIESAAALTVEMLDSGLVPAPYVNALRWALAAHAGNPTAQTLIDQQAQAIYDAWALTHPAAAALNAQAEAEEIEEYEQWKEQQNGNRPSDG